MDVATKLRNRIPEILKSRGLNISDLQRMTGMSYPAIHSIARDDAEFIDDQTRVGSLRKIGDALGVPIGELVAETN
jgi:DNA-binding Xre family transcriptional regulator